MSSTVPALRCQFLSPLRAFKTLIWSKADRHLKSVGHVTDRWSLTQTGEKTLSRTVVSTVPALRCQFLSPLRAFKTLIWSKADRHLKSVGHVTDRWSLTRTGEKTLSRTVVSTVPALRCQLLSPLRTFKTLIWSKTDQHLKSVGHVTDRWSLTRTGEKTLSRTVVSTVPALRCQLLSPLRTFKTLIWSKTDRHLKSVGHVTDRWSLTRTGEKTLRRWARAVETTALLRFQQKLLTDKHRAFRQTTSCTWTPLSGDASSAWRRAFFSFDHLFNSFEGIWLLQKILANIGSIFHVSTCQYDSYVGIVGAKPGS